MNPYKLMKCEITNEKGNIILYIKLSLKYV